MAGDARRRLFAEFMGRMYPAFSRRATQVCILSSALEQIAHGATDPQGIALAALDRADAFNWRQRASADENATLGVLGTQEPKENDRD